MKKEKKQIPAIIYKQTLLAGLFMFIGAYLIAAILIKVAEVPYDLLLTIIIDELTTCVILTILVFLVQCAIFKIKGDSINVSVRETSAEESSIAEK